MQLSRIVRKGPKFLDIIGGGREVVCRTIEPHAQGLEHTSSKTLYYSCPFCEVLIKAYVWSLAGSGKRCECGAITTGTEGKCYQFKDALP